MPITEDPNFNLLCESKLVRNPVEHIFDLLGMPLREQMKA